MNDPELLEALAAHGDDYTPRTRHLTEAGAPKYTNRLIRETSPYLLQHAHNPVDWRPWGDAAFAEAAARDVPVFLSVGYSTCHWCHVMEHESFEDEEVAAALNARFVPIKVDREERPDVDAVFMEFVQLTTGHGGWPMSVFMTPGKRPLFAGTYFPARDGDRGAHRGFLSILKAIDHNWRNPKFQAQADQVLEAMRQHTRLAPTDLPGPAALDHAFEPLDHSHDETWGGFGRAPKFPRSATLELLLRHHRRTGSARALEMVERTLEKMHCGGLYDHVGGGFARYSVDPRWHVPHFEKMLYDSAQLVVSYVEGWQATGRPLYARVVRDVLGYLEREMSHPEGGFYSATDADSADGEGHLHEGLFFTWTPDELDDVLDEEDAAWVKATFGVTPQGNFEGRTVLHLEAPLDDDEVARWETLRCVLHGARAERPAPGLDDKIVCAWNALAIQAFARAGLALGERAWVERAVKAAEFVLEKMREGDRLFRVWRGKPNHAGVLEDYAGMVNALLDLLEATGETRWLDAARALQGTLDAHFADREGGGYFRVADDGEELPIREKPFYDGAEPSGNALAALGLLRLAEITGDDDWRVKADGVLRAAGAMIERAPQAVPKLLAALDWRHDRVHQVVLVTPDGEWPAEMAAAAQRPFAPNKVMLVGPADGELARAVPLFADRDARDGVTAYLCVGNTCELPTTEPEAVRRGVAARS